MTKLLSTINRQTTANFKMYKAGKFLLTSSAAIGAAVFLQNTSHLSTVTAHADQTSTVNSANVNSSMNVPIDHSGLTNAAQDAKNNGATVDQSSTKNQTVTNSDAATAKANIQSDEAKQQAQVQSVADQQKKNNQAYSDTSKQVSDTNNTNQQKITDANNKLNDAVTAAKNAGVNVTQTTNNNTTPNYTASDNRNDQTLRDSVNKNTQANNDATTSAVNNIQDQVNQITQTTNKYIADKQQLADEQNNVSALRDQLNQSIAKAQSLGLQVNKNVQPVEDYNQAVNTYTTQKQALDTAINNWITEKAAIDKKNADNQAAYQQALADYNAKLKATVGQAGSTNQEILQQLFLGAEDNATLTVPTGYKWYTKTLDKGQNFDTTTMTDMPTTLDGDNSLGWPLDGTDQASGKNAHGTKILWAGTQLKQGQSITVNYTNLNDSSYNGGKISRIQRTFTVTQTSFDNLNLFISKDPSMGFWYFGNEAGSNGKSSSTDGHAYSQVDVTDEFFDQDGKQITIGDNAYISNGSLNNYNTVGAAASDIGAEQSSVQNADFIQIIGSTVVNHPDGYAYSDYNNNEGSFEKDANRVLPWWDNSQNSQRYLGAALYKLHPGQTSIKYSSRNVATWNGTFLWFTSDTANLPVLPKPVEPTLISDPTFDMTTVNTPMYSRQVKAPEIPFTPATQTVDKVPDSVKPDDLKTSYVLTNLTATPAAPVKTATVNGQDANNRQITKGDTVQFTLSDDALAAGRGDDVKTSYITDGLSKNLTFKDYHAYIGDEDVTSQVQMTNNNGVLTFTDGQSILDRYNKDKSNSQQTVRIVVDAVANADNATIDNTFQHFINGSTDTSNTITDIKTPGYNPTKEVLDNNDQDANNKNVEQGDSTKYLVNFDLSQVGLETLVSDDQIAKGLSVTDNYDPNFVPNTGSAFVYSTQNKTNITDLFNFDWDTASHKVTITVKDPRSFLQTYGHQILPISLFGNVSGTATGDIKNTAIQNVFGQQYSTNTVTQHVIQSAPTKSVVAKAGDSTENQPKDIAINADFWYALTSSNRPANIANDTKTWSLDDKFDKNHDLYLNNTQIYANQSFTDATGKTVAAGTNLNTYFGNDFSKYFNISFDKQNDEINVSATDAYLSLLNGSSNKNTNQQWTAYVNMKRIAAGTVNNVITENYNNRSNQSNVVTTSTNDKFEPAKRVLNSLGKDDNGQTIEQGDSIHYSMDWDLANITKDTFASATQWAHGLNFFDNYDKQFVPNKSNVKITDSQLKDITTMFNITFDDQTHQMKITPKDQHSFIASEGGQKLLVELFGQAADDATGAISNTAVQDNFGDLHKTNTVANSVSALQPQKSIEVNGTAAKPGEVPNIKLGQVFPYDLQSSTRAANLGEPTKQWSFEDKLDVVHDQYQNDGKVLSSTAFVDENGKTQPIGTDITKYFDITYDDKTGDLKFTAKQSYLDLINSDANRKIQISWLARFDVKRIAAGDSITNVFTETYNNKVTKSNQVISKTDAPAIKTQHAAEVMPQEGSVATPVVQKQLAATSSRDKTDNSELGLILLAVTGATSSLVLLKKRS